MRKLEWPEELTPELSNILGLMCFQFIRPVEAYRKAGYTINSHAEDEQAFMLHRLIGFWVKHGDGWRQAAIDDLKEVKEKVRLKNEHLPAASD